tara:strand:+ start:7026 stop:7820 length:795 start_codon:yes stop_codon:yes gene_type:complete
MNTRNKSALFFLGLIFLSISSCDLGGDDLKPINNGINFTVGEYYQYSNSFPIPAIGFYTNELFSCNNNLLYQYLETTTTSITITLRGYRANSSCSGSSSPASSIVPLYQNNGTYDLNIKYKDSEDKYKLIVSDSTMVITQDEMFTFSTPNNTKYWKYPESSFAIFAGTEYGGDTLYTQLFDSLDQKYDFTEFTFPDSGLTPYPDSLSGFEVNYATRFFKYENIQNVYSAGSFIRDFGVNNIVDRDKNRFILLDWTNVLFTTSDL